jgi:Tol biopolymer transport system component
MHKDTRYHFYARKYKEGGMKRVKIKTKKGNIGYIFAFNFPASISKIVFCCLTTFIFLILMLSVGDCATDKKFDRISNISFSHDSKKLLFDRSKDDSLSMIHVYDLETGKLGAYRPPEDEGWYTPRYSFDSKQITFTTVPENRASSKPKKDLVNAQIALMDPSGKNVKKITNSSGWKITPSFSHDDKKVIFAKAGRVGKDFPVFYDIYEVDIKTGMETRHTWFRFSLMSAPFYFPDDETIIFSASDAPNKYPGIADDDFEAVSIEKEKLKAKSIQGHRDRYTKQWRGSIWDNIYAVKKGQSEPPEAMIKSEESLYEPQITNNGLIYYYERNVIYKYSSDGKHQQIVDTSPFAIQAYTISPDGMLLAVVLYTRADQVKERYGVIIKVFNAKDGTIKKEIILPDAPATIINRP